MKSNDPYNRGGLIAFIGSVVFSIMFFGAVVFGYKGIDLKEVPEEVKDGAPTQTLAANDGASQTVDPAKLTTPWVSSDAVIQYGHSVFSNNCAVCHGQEGKGDGPAGSGLVPPPRNFVEGKWKKGGDSISLFHTLQNGIPGSSMASFSHLPKKDRWSVIQYIRSITHNKIPDDPAKVEQFAQTAQ